MWDAGNSRIEGQFSEKENVRANLKKNMIKDKTRQEDSREMCHPLSMQGTNCICTHLTSLSPYFLIAGRPKSNTNIVHRRTCIMILLGRTDCAKSLLIFMLQSFDYDSHTILVKDHQQSESILLTMQAVQTFIQSTITMYIVSPIDFQ